MFLPILKYNFTRAVFITLLLMVLTYLNCFSQNEKLNKYNQICNKISSHQLLFVPNKINLTKQTTIKLDSIGSIINELKANHLDDYKVSINSCLCENEDHPLLSAKRGEKVFKYLLKYYHLDSSKFIINRTNIVCLPAATCKISIMEIRFYIDL